MVVRKSGYWHILKTTLIFKAMHELNLDSKKHFLHILETTLISRQLEFFIVGYSHCVTREFCRGSENYHLE